MFILLAGDCCSLYSLALTCILFWMSCCWRLHNTALGKGSFIPVILTVTPRGDTHSSCAFLTLCCSAAEEPWMLCRKQEAKLPCYADHPPFSRCSAKGGFQTTQAALACVGCFLDTLTSPVPWECLWQDSAEGPAPSREPNARHHQQPSLLQLWGHPQQGCPVMAEDQNFSLGGERLSD